MCIAPCLSDGLGCRSSNAAGSSPPAPSTAPQCTHGTHLGPSCHASQTSPFPPAHSGAQKSWVGSSAEDRKRLLSRASDVEGILLVLRLVLQKLPCLLLVSFSRCKKGASELLLSHPTGTAGRFGSWSAPQALRLFPGLEGKRRSLWYPSLPWDPFSPRLLCKQP